MKQKYKSRVSDLEKTVKKMMEEKEVQTDALK